MPSRQAEIEGPRATAATSPFDGVPAWGVSQHSESLDAEQSTASLSDDSASLVAHQGKAVLMTTLQNFTLTSLSPFKHLCSLKICPSKSELAPDEPQL